MKRKTDYEGLQFGNRLIIKNYCEDEDWLKINKPVPPRKDKYVLGKCLNCGAIIPTYKNHLIDNPPKRCVICSNIGNRYKIDTTTNTWTVKDDIAICNVLYKNKTISFFIDKSDYEKSRQYNWRIAKKRNKYYVVSGSNKNDTMIYLHQLIIGKPDKNCEIDHIDGNSLNNRKSNLRQVSHQKNVDNIKKIRSDNKIGIRGVSYDKTHNQYVVDFSYHNKRIYVKPWNNIEEAVYCRYYLETMFGLKILELNPLFNKYYLEDKNKRKEIQDYVCHKFTQYAERAS